MAKQYLIIHDLLANRPAPGVVSREFVATDTLERFRDTGMEWVSLYAPVTHIGSRDGHPTATATEPGMISAASQAKLDGIESGATADQTDAEIQAALQRTDGAGSGYDADLLDGLHAAGIAGPGLSALSMETSQRVVYVSTTGSDTTGNGTSGSPWQTIQHAINQARALMQPVNSASNYKIVCKVGTYDAPVIVPPNVFSAHTAGGQGGIWLTSETGVAADVLITSTDSVAAIRAFGSCTIQNVTVENDTRAVLIQGGPAVFAYVRGCILRRRTVANGGRAAIDCNIGRAISWDNSSVDGQLFGYGLAADYVGVIGRLGFQPSGATAATVAGSGGRIG